MWALKSPQNVAEAEQVVLQLRQSSGSALCLRSRRAVSVSISVGRLLKRVMGKEQKLFLKKVREAWLREFPFFKPVDLDEVPKQPKGSTFRCDDYFSTRGVCYFVSFDFSQRRQGEFLVGITVSPSREKSVLNPPEDYTPTPTNVGTYNLAKFLNRQSFRWDLVMLMPRRTRRWPRSVRHRLQPPAMCHRTHGNHPLTPCPSHKLPMKPLVT